LLAFLSWFLALKSGNPHSNSPHSNPELS
jgi:hypothetical protein